MSEQKYSMLELGVAKRLDTDTVRLRLNLGAVEFVVDAKLTTAASLAGSIANALAQSGELFKPVPAQTPQPGLEHSVDRNSSFSEREAHFLDLVRKGHGPARVAGLLNLRLHFDEAKGGHYVTDATDK